MQPEDIPLFWAEMEKQMSDETPKPTIANKIKQETREAVLRNMYLESVKMLDLSRCLMDELEKVLTPGSKVTEVSDALIDDALTVSWTLGTYLATYDEKDFIDADDDEDEEEEEEEEEEAQIYHHGPECICDNCINKDEI